MVFFGLFQAKGVMFLSLPVIFFSIFSYIFYTIKGNYQCILWISVCRMGVKERANGVGKFYTPCRLSRKLEEKRQQNQ